MAAAKQFDDAVAGPLTDQIVRPVQFHARPAGKPALGAKFDGAAAVGARRRTILTDPMRRR